jgi:ABC-2 type transport system ATP-binding protein
VLVVSGLNKIFPGKKPVHAVRDVSFTISAGEVVGLLGPNGAGKTTTIKCILGLMRPTSGEISVNGFGPRTQYSQLLRQVSAVLEGSRNIYWRQTPVENMLFFAGLYGISVKEARPYVDFLIERFKLTDKRDTEVRQLSSGMKQKVAVACALVKRTPLVFLDEPTVGLDVETSYDLRHILREMAAAEKRTFVISSHDMHVIQDVCARVIIISTGRIIADEKVVDLLALFRTRTYRFTLAGEVDGGLREDLRVAFPQAEMEVGPSRTTVAARFARPEQLYEMIDIIRRSGAIVDSVAQQEPDLEQAYLELVRKERQTA